MGDFADLTPRHARDGGEDVSRVVFSLPLGTGSGYLINNVGGYPSSTTTVAVDTGTGTIVIGDVVTFAGVSGEYVVTSELSGGSFSFTPGLAGSVADDAAVTVLVDNEVIPAPSDSAKSIRVLGGVFSCDEAGADNAVQFKTGGSSGAVVMEDLLANNATGPATLPWNPAGWLQCDAGDNLYLDHSGGTAPRWTGTLIYVEV